jgi:hypothetical protein
MSLSTFGHMLSAQLLLSHSGENGGEQCLPCEGVALPDSRRVERVFGKEGNGRLTAHCRPKGEHAQVEISCIRAFAAAMDAE